MNTRNLMGFEVLRFESDLAVVATDTALLLVSHKTEVWKTPVEHDNGCQLRGVFDYEAGTELHGMALLVVQSEGLSNQQIADGVTMNVELSTDVYTSIKEALEQHAEEAEEQAAKDMKEAA